MRITKIFIAEVPKRGYLETGTEKVWAPVNYHLTSAGFVQNKGITLHTFRKHIGNRFQAA